MADTNSGSDPVEEYLQRTNGTPVIQTAILGAKGVGKDNIITRLGHDATIADDAFDPFGELDFHLQTVVAERKVDIEGILCEPSLTLSATDHKPGTVSAYMMLRHCETIFLVYDVGSWASFEAVRHYYRNILLERNTERRDICLFMCQPSCPPRPPYRGVIFVVANKIDRPDEEWEVKTEEGQRFCESIGGIFHVMSAKKKKGRGKERLSSMARQVLWRRVENESILQLLEAHAAEGFTLPRVEQILRDRNKRFWY